jgi:hypothetical protein
LKNQSLQALQIGKTLLEQSTFLSLSNDAASASSSLVVLQDALELILLASLIEIGADETTNLESLSFDQLLGELRKNGIPVPKSGTLKALNKARTVVKHYGQPADQAAVGVYLEATNVAIEAILMSVFGRSLAEIQLSEVLGDAVSRPHIDAALKCLEGGDFWNALVETRKAIFLEVESDYDIRSYKDGPPNGLFAIRGWKAPWHTKKASWIADNVETIFQYIQLDHDRVRVDLLEWGVPTSTFWNLWRLTPSVYQNEETKIWSIAQDWQHVSVGATETNAKYCVNAAIDVIARKLRHSKAARSIEYGFPRLTVEIVAQTSLYSRADEQSPAKQALDIGSRLEATGLVVGVDTMSEFVEIMHIGDGKFLMGYVPLADCKLLTRD